MKRRIAAAVLAAFLFLVLLSGCAAGKQTNDHPVSDTSKASDDASRLFVQKVEYQEGDEYFVSYKNQDGSVVKIDEISDGGQLLAAAGQRVYYATGVVLVSVNFEGKDRKIFQDSSPNRFSFARINSVSDGWLYCSGKKMTEIYGDPVAADGAQFVPANMKVKTDFTECEEIK